ncbi:hypothetical protein EM6_1191 [Asticcacaulis excentricus]|uniref:Uncharacterized protein n=1 Tax=Asticcacaulis excentricus TaxID=78587 RepID=A0A3G9G1M8_9CAUL|nr:hypothetical protein EM6_1191 [Asticcacaulis excentricus]
MILTPPVRVQCDAIFAVHIAQHDPSRRCEKRRGFPRLFVLMRKNCTY